VTRGFAKQFEPILFFHPSEQFFPIDPKWYLERSSLWRAASPYADKNSWGEPPLKTFPRVPAVYRNNLAALQSEAAGKTWIGEPSLDLGVAKAVEGQHPPGDEHFLDFGGWEPPIVAGSEVTSMSMNRYAALDPSEYAGPLTGSRPWYYVEYLNNADLIAFTKNRTPNGHNLFGVVTNKIPLSQALVYHFFYPVHQEALEGCEKTGEATKFASFSGEWGSMAILLNSANRPAFIGLTSRNVGDPSIVEEEELRVGMSIFPWSKVQTVTTSSGDHPKLYVSNGTHGYYYSPGSHPVIGFTPGYDSSRRSCGLVETLDDAISSEYSLNTSVPPDNSPSEVVIILKVVSLILIWWAVIEVNSDQGQDVIVDTWATPTQPTDQTAADPPGGPGFGKIIRPAGLSFPEASRVAPDMLVDWKVNPYTAADGRAYDLAIDRNVQVWWNPRTETVGYCGRWGPRVEHDPFGRRCGMKCPDFLTMFLEGIAVLFNI